MQLPSDYVQVDVDGAVVVVRRDVVAALLEAGVADPDALVARAPSAQHVGRARLARVDLGDGGAAIVRALTRGGLLGKLVRRVSFDRDRALSELRVTCEAAARGAPVLEVLAAVTRPCGLGWRHGLVTREVARARDLMQALREEVGPARAAVRRRALAAAGRAVRRLHEAGVDHVDLNLKNVLLGPDGEALVIDLDRCRIGPGPLDEAARLRNLLRLLRSWRKLQAASPGATQPRDPLRLARAYADGDRALFARLARAGLQERFTLHTLRWRLLRPPEAQ